MPFFLAAVATVAIAPWASQMRTRDIAYYETERAKAEAQAQAPLKLPLAFDATSIADRAEWGVDVVQAPFGLLLSLVGVLLSLPRPVSVWIAVGGLLAGGAVMVYSVWLLGRDDPSRYVAKKPFRSALQRLRERQRKSPGTRLGVLIPILKVGLLQSVSWFALTLVLVNIVAGIVVLAVG